MRKLFLFIALFLGVLAVGCEELFPAEQQSPNATPIFRSDSEGSYIVKAEGEEIIILVTTNIDYSVVIPTDTKGWISVVQTRSDTREEMLAFVVAPNNNFKERTGIVSIVDSVGKVLDTISFIQEEQSEVFTIDGNGNYTVAAKGGNVKVAVTTNMEYSVVIPKSVQSWLSVANTRATLREETLTFIVAENSTFDERKATVELVDADKKVLQKISFVQSGQTKVFETDSKGNYIVVAEGGNVDVNVTTNLEYSVVIPTAAQSWLSVADTRATLREETLTFIVAPNATYDERTATVKLVDDKNKVLQTISFVQNGLSKAFDTDSNGNYVVVADGGNVYVNVTTNLEYSVVIEKNAQSWLSVANTRAELREETLTFIIAPNNTFVERSAIVELVDASNKVLQTISFIQDAAIEPDLGCPSDEIWYTNGSTTETTKPNATGVFGANILSNTYDAAKECWVIKFDGEVTTIGDAAFYECSNLTSVTIPDSVTSIGFAAFRDCSSLTSVTIGNSVTAIGKSAFGGCESLTSVTIPDSVTTIGEYVFEGCVNLVSITIPEGVTSIGAKSFSSCVSLVSVTIPNSVTEIGYLAFEDCSNLTSVYCKAITQPNTIIGVVYYYDPGAGLPNIPGSPSFPTSPVTRYGWEAFNGNASDRKIYVPMESVEAYKSAEYWSEYASDIVGYNF